MNKGIAFLVAACAVGALNAQELIECGAGSYASYAPWIRARTAKRGGDQSRFMQNRPIYVSAERKGDPLPTNDWWTHMLVDRFSGNLWAYPVLARASAQGVTVSFPSYWIENGTEMKAKSSVTVGGGEFNPEAAVVTSWHDWDVEFRMSDGERHMDVTLAHGMPYVWFETRGFEAEVFTEPADFESVSKNGSHEVIKVGDDFYGITRGKGFLVVSLLPTADAKIVLDHATAIPRETRVDWSHDAKAGVVKTVWNVKCDNLGGGSKAVALQGFQPHHYRRTSPKFDFVDGLAYVSPRGEMRMAVGNSLEIDYAFPGMVPYWPMPQVGVNARRDTIFRELLTDYADKGGYGADTYWGGKGLLQMAFAMMGARERADDVTYRKAHASLRAAFENWLTWTPGEKERYFCYVPRWGGMVGENTSYDSDTFNDHHFHYGYFTYAGALLCLVDEDFKVKYGPMLRMLAGDYANWNREDKRFPFFRTFDPWAGHSFAGGMGDGAGNGQESSSEAMQGWGGLYWLGVALGDDAMRDAGLFGYVSEARGTAEYWFDRDRRNIDYTKYKHPYNSNLTCHGVGWWTFFSGDPVWMHSIQWLPSTPVLDYLSEDRKFAKWDYETMWKTKQISDWEAELGDASLGNVLLSYWQRFDPKGAEKQFNELWDYNRKAAHNPDTAHMTWWQIQAHLEFGDIDDSVHADVPWARAYRGNGGSVFVAYNPYAEAKSVTFYDANGSKVGALNAKPQSLTVSGRESKALAPIKVGPKKEPLVPAGVSLVDLALGRPAVVSSFENDGLKAENLTDGKPNTRWGSGHDDEAMTADIDLGESCALYAVEFAWENARASAFAIEVSNDGKAWNRVGEYGGHPGVQRVDLDGRKASWVRMRALSKAIPQYGVSMFRFSVYGRKGAAKAGDVIGVAIGSDRVVLKEGAASKLSARGWCGGKSFVPVVAKWSSPDGDFAADGSFTPRKAGEVTVVAEVNGVAASRTFPVEEALKAQKLEVEPKSAETIVGEPVKISLSALDQFGGKMPLKGVKIAVDGPKGGALKKGGFVASVPGEYKVSFTLGGISVESRIKVVNAGEVNLARLAKVSASGEENPGLAAGNAVDGDLKSRWSSAHRDGEWLQLDFGKPRKVSRASILWENARADRFRIDAHVGGKWITLKKVEHANNKRDDLEWSPVDASKIRLVGETRNTPYGVSVWEFEVR